MFYACNVVFTTRKYFKQTNNQLLVHDCSTLALVHNAAPAHLANLQGGSLPLRFIAEASRPQILRAGIAAKALARPGWESRGISTTSGASEATTNPNRQRASGPERSNEG